LFDESVSYDGQPQATAGRKMEDRLAPVFGETAALLDRLEFEPTNGEHSDADLQPADHLPEPPPAPGPPGAPPPPRAPKPQRIIVVDVPKIVAEARRAGREAAAAGANIGIDVGAIVADALKESLPDIEAGVAAAAGAVSREGMT